VCTFVTATGSPNTGYDRTIRYIDGRARRANAYEFSKI